MLLLVSTARHGDGLYDSYMRTDHVVNQDADVNGQSPSGLPPLPKHTVSSDFLFPHWCPWLSGVILPRSHGETISLVREQELVFGGLEN